MKNKSTLIESTSFSKTFGLGIQIFTGNPEFECSMHPSYDQSDQGSGPEPFIKRRTPPPDGDIDDARYPEYDIGQTTVLAIAFTGMLPSNFVTEQSVPPHLREHVPPHQMANSHHLWFLPGPHGICRIRLV